MVSRLFNEQTGFYAAIMMAVGTGIFFQNAFFGFIDHHLPQCILFIVCILSILLLTKNKLWIIPALLSGAALYFISPITWIIYYAIIAGVVWVLVAGFVASKHIKLFAGFIVASIVGIMIVIDHILSLGMLNLWGWSEPITEIAPANTLFLLSHYNILIIPVVVGLMLFLVSKFDVVETVLVASTIITFALTLRFIRMELVLFPLVIILSAVYLNKIFKMETSIFSKTVGRGIVCIFIAMSVMFGCLTVSYFVTESHYNERFNGAIQFLSEQPHGMVLSSGNYGHWLRLSVQSIYSDPNQWNVTQMAQVFTDKTFPNDPINYILVTNNDWNIYPELQWYAGSNTTYENSYLHTLIEGNETGLIYNKEGIKIYQHKS
jgi:hypothetical protein